jgi:hypothetical protein
LSLIATDTTSSTQSFSTTVAQDRLAWRMIVEMNQSEAGETLSSIAKSYAVDISMISRLALGFRSPFEASAA